LQGPFTGKLNNGSQDLTLPQGADVVWSFAYDDNDPWRTGPDGSGHPLQRTGPAAPGYGVLTWTAALPTPCADLSLADTDINLKRTLTDHSRSAAETAEGKWNGYD